MVADLAQLHEAVDDAQEVTGRERVASLRAGHKVVVKVPLAFRHAAVDDGLGLAGHLRFDLRLETTQKIRTQDRVQLIDGSLCFGVHDLAALDRAVHRVRKPRLKVAMLGERTGTVCGETLRHQEVEERPLREVSDIRFHARLRDSYTCET